MAVFKKFDNQQAYQLMCFVDGSGASYEADDEIFNVGDVFGYNVATGEISHLDALADIKGAVDDGMEIYIVAQDDAVTHKTGTAYKSYKVGNGTVTVGTTSATKALVVAYRVENIENIVL